MTSHTEGGPRGQRGIARGKYQDSACQKKADNVSYAKEGKGEVILTIRRIILVFVLFLLTVSAASVIFASDADCDECCSTGDCTDCQDCHCASISSFVLPTCSGSGLYIESCGEYPLPSLGLAERAWYFELDRPPRSHCS